jgi:hypothetical protein
MSDLSFNDVASLAKAAGVKLDQDDLVEVTHRLNVTIEGVEQFSHPELHTIEAVPFHPLDEPAEG